ncbi:cation:proton antiporter regulatory subunit [Thermocrinis jamiesonii]|jgi:potassium/proton antiporter regulatory subunit, CPA2 family (TC 2.A.37.5.2)|uniref:cation:proton antiporter regulatory subunit n=1 Tax=Thermocrinis jamiesonii TaxID=1302351 RepID=UPI000496E1D9|nr:cation:proton antiporter regulatory subunit [Thermocrinis jamiesonii]
MKIKETDLPGIGKKYGVLLKSGKELVIIIHNTGRREIYLMKDEEPSCFIELTDEEARDLGFLLAGATYQPVSSEKMEMILQQVVMEWVKVEEGSNFAGKTIAQLEIRRKTGVSIIAIERGGKVIPSPDPYTEKIEVGDTLISVGTRQQIKSFLELCGRCST